MNILIVGGSGFIGKYLTESLLDFGQSVSIIDIADKPKKLNKKAAYYKQLNINLELERRNLINPILLPFFQYHLLNITFTNAIQYTCKFIFLNKLPL